MLTLFLSFLKIIFFNFILQDLIYKELVFMFFFVIFIELSQSCDHCHNISELTWIFLLLFLTVYFSISSFNIELFDN
jgi:hypothetical protein